MEKKVVTVETFSGSKDYNIYRDGDVGDGRGIIGHANTTDDQIAIAKSDAGGGNVIRIK